MFGKIGKAFGSVYHVAVISKMVFSCSRTSFIGYGIGRIIQSAGPAIIAEFSYACINGFVCLQRHICNNTSHAKQRPQLRIDDGTMPPQLTKTGFQSNGYVQNIAVANRVFYPTGITKRTNKCSKRNHGFAQCVVYTQALNGRFCWGNCLKRTLKHTLTDCNGKFFSDRASIINIGRLYFTNTHQISPKFDGFFLQ